MINNICLLSTGCTTGFIGKPTPRHIEDQLIQKMSITELQSNKQQLYYKDKKIFRCNFTDSCSAVQYLNTSSGAWQHTHLHRCFDVTTNNDNFTDTFAELTVCLFKICS